MRKGLSPFYSQAGFLPLLLVVPVFVVLIVLVFSISFPFKQQLVSSIFPQSDEVIAGVSSGPETSLSLSPQSIKVAPGGEFQVSVEVRSDEQSTNAFDASITFPANLLEVTGLKTEKTATDAAANYFITHWIEKKYDNTSGTVSLIGGVINPGFKTTAGEESPIMATISFKAKTYGNSPVSFSSSAAIINGSGTVVNSIKRNANVTIITQATATPSPVATTNPTNPPSAGKSVIKVFAAGTSADGVYPNMSLQVFDTGRNRWNTVKTYNGVMGNPNSRTFQEFSYEHTSKIAASKYIRVRFINDRHIPKKGEDRNLVVDKIILDGIEYQSESPSIFSTGSWTAKRGCKEGFAQSEWLHCNGYFEYR